MSTLRLSGGEQYISNGEITKRVEQLAQHYSERYKHEDELIILNILQGANTFAVDLARKIMHPKIRFAVTQLSSRDGVHARRPEFSRDAVPVEVTGKPLLVVESIDHSRATLAKAMPRFRDYQPKILDLVTLVNNAEAEKCIDTIDADSVEYGYQIADRFVVGYGLDWNGLYRDFSHLSTAYNAGTEAEEFWVPHVDKFQAAQYEKYGASALDLTRLQIAGL